MIKARVLFFGITADITGHRKVEFELPPQSNVGDILEKLVTDHPMLANHRLHFSVNQQYAMGDEIVRDGDELAIFTAVSGG